MTVSVNRSRVQYTGNGSTTAFNVTFPAITQAEIVVTVTTAGVDSVKTLNTHYTLTAAPFSTGTVTFLTSPSDYTPANNTTITISRNLDFLQSTDYQANDALDATTLETAFDKATLLAQQLDDDKSRMLKFSGTLTDSFDSDDTITTITSSSSDRANKALKFDANGDIGISTNDPDAQVADATTQATNAGNSATAAATSATLAGNYATKVDGVVTGSDYSSKEYAQGTQASTGGSAKNWATQTGADVTGASSGDMSSKEWAVGTLGRGVASEGSSKDWATYTSGTVDNADYSAKYWALDAEQSKLAAKASAAAVANVYDNFADTFLGSMADNATATSGSANGTWSASSSSITLASTSGTIEVGQEVTGSGIPTDANVLSVDGSTIVISENMTAAGSSVSLTFTGQGVYGAFNGSKDGPATDNDGDALATGALYFNSTDNEMRVYDGANWLAASAAGGTSLLIYKYSASGSQTTFTGSDANGATLSYVANNILVFLNGVKLDATDYTATNGTSVVLGSGATASDELVVVAFKSFTTADMVPASTGGTFSGNVATTGNIQVDDIVEKTSAHGVEIDGVLLKDGGLETSTAGKIKQKGAFLQSSTHQALTLGY